ncbi:hypothetical protein KVR01_003603 [Diaporthe batatas]|uniref:uncharacterized protein n=1 Tax=Diaporthe batatas TaxID=748121 RepID=UPI001D05A77C|nr:uncharacterized protein KVR01_003603 [Diaporthe batatas]KAG8167914.1 hypothetical protein KVR01_003603 [Diaporthe batatas]
MDAFLLDAPEPDHACASAEDLALELAQLRNAKVTDTKAEHITATFEFNSTVVFNVQEYDNEVAESQSAGGTPGAAPPAPMQDGAPSPATREIRAMDTLLNQPTDDPALQKLVAKHIIASLGSVDGSSWTVRSVSRNSSGWTFTYLCKHSMQAWVRQNSKHSAKLRLAESSGKDGQDPTSMSRPAFDCRGSVTIAFVKSRRAITVKLEHTPLHKTVAELAELFKPPPLLPRTEAAKRKSGDRKRKTQADGVEAPGGGPKKKSKKTANTSEQDGGHAPKPKKPRASKSKKAQNVAAQPQADSAQNGALLNLSPLETARRQEEASKKLRDNGIDPDTLSAEQFNIFANQSPDLQLESLAMLVKYGAERLRIVHPSKDNTPQPSGPSSGDSPNASKKRRRTLPREGPSEDRATKVKKTRGSCQACRAKKIKCTKDKPECQECVGAGIACYYPPPQTRKSAGAKSAEVAVDDPGSPEAAHIPNNIPDSMPGSEVLPDTAPDEEASDLGSPGFNTSQPHEVMPHQTDTTTFAEAAHDVAQDLYQPAPGGLSYPQGMGIPEDMPNTDYFQSRAATNGITYPQPPHQASDVAYADSGASAPQHQPQDPDPVPLQSDQIPSQPDRQTLSRNGTRRSLPSGSGQHLAVYPNPTDPAPAASWQSTNTPSNTVQAYSESPATSQSAPTSQYRNKQSVAQTTYDTIAQDTLQAATTLTQAALQKRPHASPTARTTSPFANPTQVAQVARTKSRQSQRAQSRQTASSFQQSAAPQPSPVAAASSLYNPPPTTTSESVPGYDQYSRYGNTPTQANTTSSRIAYEPYSQQAGSSSSATSYSGYGTYDSRSKAPSTTPLSNPVSQSATLSHGKAAAPSSKNWAGGNGRQSNSYSSNRSPVSAPAYNVPVSPNQQQSTTMQSFNARPQSTASAQSRASGNTPASYPQQSRQQRPQQSQHAYNSYSSQPHPATNQQQQQDWYGFGSTDNATSNYGSGYGQHRSMNLTGNTYSSMNEQEALYEMLRNNSRH